jgi:hypothetical protein
VRRALFDPSEAVRDAAWSKASWIEDLPIDLIRKGMRDRSDSVAYGAARVLSRRASFEVVRELEAFYDRRGYHYDILFDFAEQADAHVRPVVGRMLTKSDPKARVTAIMLIGLRDFKELVPAALALLADKDEEVRYALAGLLDDLPLTEALQLAARLLRDPEPRVRMQALEPTARLGVDALPLIRRALNDSDSEVAELARQHIRTLGGN